MSFQLLPTISLFVGFPSCFVLELVAVVKRPTPVLYAYWLTDSDRTRDSLAAVDTGLPAGTLPRGGTATPLILCAWRSTRTGRTALTGASA